MKKEEFLALVDQVREHDERVISKFLALEEVGKIIECSISNLGMRNIEIPRSDFQVIAKTELWNLINEIDIDRERSMGEIIRFITEGLRNKIRGFIALEKQLIYVKDSGYQAKYPVLSLDEDPSIVSVAENISLDDALEERILTLNVPQEVKALAILFLCYGWNYQKMSLLTGLSESHARIRTNNCLKIVNGLLGIVRQESKTQRLEVVQDGEEESCGRS